MFDQAVAIGCLFWYVLVAVVTSIGTVQIFRRYSRPPQRPVSSHLDLHHVPHVTIIRPCKGVEPFLYECLASTFHQDYPQQRTTYRFCVSSKADGAYSILQQLLVDYPQHDCRIYVEEEDPVLQGHNGGDFGPNPKIRNMSRAYREARGDLIWILDCNIWVGYGALGRMVDKLCGFTNSANTGQNAQTRRPFKLVAHLPICVDVDSLGHTGSREHSTSASATDDSSTVPLLSASASKIQSRAVLTGSMLETSFLSTAHAKMYVAINSVSIAPCINGKSTMFRKLHLGHLTQSQGIDYFSHNICEDHLIGDLLWKSHIPANLGFEHADSDEIGNEIQKSNPRGLKYGNHGFAVGDLAIQPMAQMSVVSYIARRVRWLRVRKFTVMLATLVEPGTESLVCCAMGAFGVTTTRGMKERFGESWAATVMWFMIAMCYWCLVDWFVSGTIQGMGSVETQKSIKSSQQRSLDNVTVPVFAKLGSRKFSKWITAWLGRECLAFWIWAWAIWGGTTVTWRDRKFWVSMDMRVHEIPSSAEVSGDNARLRSDLNREAGASVSSEHTSSSSTQNGNSNGKGRKLA